MIARNASGSEPRAQPIAKTIAYYRFLRSAPASPRTLDETDKGRLAILTWHNGKKRYEH